MAEDSFKPPAAARTAAAHGLKLRKEWGRGGTPVGVARARDLAGGKNVSRSTVARMSSFARHLDQPEAEHKEGPSARAVAIKLWGGRKGIEWAQGVMRKLARAKKKKGG